MKDLHSNIDVTQNVAIAAKVVGGSPYNGSDLDLAGYEGAEVVVDVGVVTDGTHVVKLQESDVGGGSGYTDVAAADQIGTFPANLTSNTAVRVGYIGLKRFIRSVITSAGTTTGAVAGTKIVRAFPRHAPLP